MASSIDLADRPIALQGIASVQPAGYSAIELRRLASTALDQEGVLGSGDFKVTPGAGAKQLAVAAGEAGVDGDSVSNQGRYYQRSSGSQTLDLAVVPDATNPRIDQLVLEIKDDIADGSGLNVGRLRVVSGTATGGATLANRTGAAALPSTCIRLADILVPAAYNAVFVQNTHIRDRRPWARGALRRIKRNANAAAGNDYSNTGAMGALTLLDATNIQPRIECSGVPLRCKLSTGGTISGAPSTVDFAAFLDGALAEGDAFAEINSGAASAYQPFFQLEFVVVPTPGSHLIGPAIRVVTASITVAVFARAALALYWTVEELVKPDVENSGA